MNVPSLPTTQSDPSGLFGAVGTTAGAVLALLVVVGILDGETAEAILAVVVTIGPLVTAWAIRRHAFAPESVRGRENLIRADHARQDLDGAATATRDRAEYVSETTREALARETYPREDES